MQRAFNASEPDSEELQLLRNETSALLRERYRGGQSFYVCPRIEDIAEATGIPKATIYYHLDGKNGVLEFLLTDLLDTMEQTSLCALGGGVPLPIKNALQYFEAELKDYFKP